LFSSTLFIHYYDKITKSVKAAYLEHVLAHGVIEFVFEGFIFKVEFDFDT